MSIYSSYSESIADIIGLNQFDEERVITIADKFLSPIPGELRFQTEFYDLTENGLSLDQNNVYKVIDEDFDGWVYPDGKSKFYCEDFPEISSEYVVNATDTTFIVPELTTYFKSSSNEEVDYTTMIKSTTQLFSHRHTLDGFSSRKIDAYPSLFFKQDSSTNTYQNDTKDSKNAIIGNSNPTPFISELNLEKENYDYPPKNIKCPVIRRCPSNKITYNTKGNLTFSTSYVREGSLEIAQTNNIYSKILAYDRVILNSGVENPVFQPAAINIPVMIYLGRKR